MTGGTSYLRLRLSGKEQLLYEVFQACSMGLTKVQAPLIRVAMLASSHSAAQAPMARPEFATNLATIHAMPKSTKMMS